MNARKTLGSWCLLVAFVAASSLAAVAEDNHSDIHAAAAEVDDFHAADAPVANPLVFDPDLAIFSGIVFLILVFVLGKFAWPTIAAALDERERSIADNIAAAEAKHDEARQMLAAYEAKLAAAASEVRDLLDEARRNAELTKNRIVAEAKQAAQEESARAIREVELAKHSAMQELAVTSANLAIDLAGKVVGEQLSKQKHEQIVRDALGKLVTTKPSQN
jgi:F-type H+-transporting ATPase subunit b